jgi:type I restriction enzyme S subunit
MIDLPVGWIRVCLGDIISIRNGFAFKSVDFSKKGTPVIRQSNLTGALVDLTERVCVSADVAKRASGFSVKRGDILLGMSGSIGEPSTYDYDFDALQNQRTGLVRFYVDDEGHRKFVKQALAYYEQDYLARGKGLGVQNVSAKDIEKTEIPLPPLREQGRIVVKIGELSYSSRRARDELAHVRSLIETYKQAILAAAFRGDLTREWRESNAGNHWPWPEVPLSQIASVGTGSTPKRGEARYYANGYIPWVTSGAVNAPVVEVADEFITDAAIQETNCKVFPAGTLLMAMYGEGQTRGRVAILGLPAATNQALAAIQIDGAAPVVRNFVLWHLRSGYMQLRAQAAGGVQPNLNLGIVKAWRLPLPSTSEQQEIVRRIETAVAWTNRLSSEVASACKLIDRLDRAILGKAFGGELLPQDPADEPARVLVEGIRGRRASAPSDRGKRGSRGRFKAQ